jgi:tripartite-type tricarboxylate transporter receptor subunit TctC
MRAVETAMPAGSPLDPACSARSIDLACCGASFNVFHFPSLSQRLRSIRPAAYRVAVGGRNCISPDTYNGRPPVRCNAASDAIGAPNVQNAINNFNIQAGATAGRRHPATDSRAPAAAPLDVSSNASKTEQKWGANGDARCQGGDVMKLPRRHLLHLAAGAASLPIMRRARATTYPARAVRILVGFPAGLAPDIIARHVGQPLSERLGQPVIIENRPGAGANLAVDVVAKAAPDGYTLLLIVPTSTVGPMLYPSLGSDFRRDIVPVAGIGLSPFVLVVHPAVPAKSVPAFIAYAKANPGKIDVATPGVGTVPHVFGEMFRMMTGAEMQYVPYRSNFYPDLLGGQVKASFVTILSSAEYVRAGQLRALGLTTAKRADALPGVPTIGESVPGYAASGWYAIGAPTGTPAEVVARLNGEIDAVVADPQMQTRLAGLGIERMSPTRAALTAFIADETAKWTKVVTFAGIKPM